ncbi:hypothetical protein ABZ801_35305 [Actinomadura sp. NPDC047616]|uniref:hypothetical protein n=1 Tax=Actinomadura sp. NPDC047616 TaxID=3155914 RepID=UPI0033F5B31A
MPISDLLDQRLPSGPTVVRGAEVEVLRGAAVDLRPLHGIEAANWPAPGCRGPSWSAAAPPPPRHGEGNVLVRAGTS